MRVKILKNTTLSDISISTTGLTIPAQSEVEIVPEVYAAWGNARVGIEINPLINSGDIIVNDGVEDLNPSEGLAYILFPNEAASMRFDNSGTDFQSKNVRDAIKEAAIFGSSAINCFDAGIHLTSRIFGAYNSVGGQTINSSPSTIIINQQTDASDQVAFNLASGELEFFFEDDYTLIYSVTFDDTNSTRTTTRSILEINRGSGFVEIEGSEVFTYERTSGNAKQTGTATIPITINRGDIIRIRSNIENGSNNTVVENGCRLQVIPSRPKSEDGNIGIDGSDLTQTEIIGSINCGVL